MSWRDALRELKGNQNVVKVPIQNRQNHRKESVWDRWNQILTAINRDGIAWIKSDTLQEIIGLVENDEQREQLWQKHPESVIYSLREWRLLTENRHNAEGMKLIHLTKKILASTLIESIPTSLKTFREVPNMHPEVSPWRR